MIVPLERTSAIVSAEADRPPLRKAKLGAFFWFTLMLACLGAFTADVLAADVTGAWTSDTSNCSRIFVKTPKGVFLAENADLYGSGFVVEGRKIKGRMANCDIKTIKEEGSTVHLIAACATDVMLSNVQITFKVVNQDRVVRLFPGMPEIEIPYDRCTLR